MGDMTAHGGTIILGEPTVMIGESAQGSSLTSAAQSGAPLVGSCE
jgi:hypothetical protein